MKSIGVYWLTLEPHQNHLQKAALLESYGYRVTFFKTIESLSQGIFDQRVPIVIVGDEGPEMAVINAIQELGNMPTMQGARLILTVSRPALSIMRIAACEGFRDILSLDMPEQEWFQRFVFSSSSKSMPFQVPAAPIYPYTEEGLLAVPARIVWITEKNIAIESKIAPRLHQNFNLSGPIVQSMGVKHLIINPCEIYHTNLLFHFSEGIIGTWELPSGSADTHKIETMDIARSLDRGERYRIFLAIQSPALRESVVKYLEPERFEVHSALSKRSLTEEPKYFGPQVAIMEDRFHLEGETALFRQWASSLPPQCVIITVGGKTEVSQIKNLVSGRKILTFKHVPMNLRSILLDDILPKCAPSLANDRLHVPPDHEYSLAEIRVPTEIIGIGAKSVSLRVSESIGSYSLVRIRSPFFEKILNKKPFVKIIAATSKEDPINEKPYWELVCGYAELGLEDQQKLIHALAPPKPAPTPAPSSTHSSITAQAVVANPPRQKSPRKAVISLSYANAMLLLLLFTVLTVFAYFAGRSSVTH